MNLKIFLLASIITVSASLSFASDAIYCESTGNGFGDTKVELLFQSSHLSYGINRGEYFLKLKNLTSGVEKKVGAFYDLECKPYMNIERGSLDSSIECRTANYNETPENEPKAFFGLYFEIGSAEIERSTYYYRGPRVPEISGQSSSMSCRPVNMVDAAHNFL